MKRTASSPLIVAVLFFAGCGPLIDPTATETVSVSMRWACYLPEHLDVSDFAKQNPAAKPVTLSFVRYPNFVLVAAQPGLCDALTAAGKPVIPVVIHPLRSWPHGKMVGYNVLSVNGYAVGGPYGVQEAAALDGHQPPLEELLR